MADNLIKWIEPVRARREEYAAHPDQVLQILDDGSKGARSRAENDGARPRSRVRLEREDAREACSRPNSGRRQTRNRGQALMEPTQQAWRHPTKFICDTYDGPLDLLLDLIRSRRWTSTTSRSPRSRASISTISTSSKQLDMDISADFIYMAATLIYIKSKMLLPPDPLAGPEEQEDPRADLVHRLVEHEKFKSAAQLLHQRSRSRSTSGPSRTSRSTRAKASEGELIVSLVDLVKVFQQVLERRKEVVKIELHHEQFTVAQMMELLRQQLVAGEDGIELIGVFRVLPVAPCHDLSRCSRCWRWYALQAIVLVQQELFVEDLAAKA